MGFGQETGKGRRFFDPDGAADLSTVGIEQTAKTITMEVKMDSWKIPEAQVQIDAI